MIPFWTLWVPDSECVETNRGKYSRHHVCDGCGRVLGAGDEGLLRRDLRDRKLVTDITGSIIIERELWLSLESRRILRDLRASPMPVFESPVDDWVLPGDPGWDGVLRTPESLKKHDAAIKRKLRRKRPRP